MFWCHLLGFLPSPSRLLRSGPADNLGQETITPAVQDIDDLAIGENAFWCLDELGGKGITNLKSQMEMGMFTLLKGVRRDDETFVVQWLI
ncbi:hypothetical protein Taro_025726 [Colocasia esculenta]|uniref:Uncharacterized protein n=1 Tax=Colocasia esculenta TaxID=4460 RepID=A0A843VIE9_COLES|nr:hypothetical protein [Colocasia esculenta]